MSKQTTVDELMEVLRKDPERQERLRAVRLLSEVAAAGGSDAQIAGGLGDAVRKDDQWVRRAASIALADMGTSTAISELESCLADENKYVRRAAVKALVSSGAENALPTLQRALTDPNCEVRNVAVDYAATVDATKAAERFAPLLDEKASPFVRASVARALGKIGHRGLIGALKNRLWFFRFEDHRVKAACKEALQEIEENTKAVASLPAPACAPKSEDKTLPRPSKERAGANMSPARKDT